MGLLQGSNLATVFSTEPAICKLDLSAGLRCGRFTPFALRAMLKKVLVIDDEWSANMLLHFTLNGAGFETVGAQNGLEAWNLLQESQFHLVITDNQMPLLGGVELCQVMRQHRDFAKVPIIMLTASLANIDTAELRKRMSPIEFFQKPFFPADFLKVARKLCGMPEPTIAAGAI